jgi:hypothetical protein
MNIDQVRKELANSGNVSTDMLKKICSALLELIEEQALKVANLEEKITWIEPINLE